MKINLLVYLQLFRHTIGQVFIYVKFILLNVNSKEFLLIVILCSTLIMKYAWPINGIVFKIKIDSNYFLCSIEAVVVVIVW